jgi:hypothetical protein
MRLDETKIGFFFLSLNFDVIPLYLISSHVTS